MKKNLESLGSFKNKSLNQLEMSKIFGGYAQEESTGGGSSIIAVEDGAAYGHYGQCRNITSGYTSDCRDCGVTTYSGQYVTTGGWTTC